MSEQNINLEAQRRDLDAYFRKVYRLDEPWTAEKCKRLLQPIIKGLAVHEKFQELSRTDWATRRSLRLSPEQHPRLRKRSSEHLREHGEVDSSNNDQGSQHVSGNPRKRRKVDDPPTALTSATPFMHCLRVDESDKIFHESQLHFRKPNSYLSKSVKSTAVFVKVCGPFFHVLKATDDPTSCSTESPSLFSMCLRKVPHHMADEEVRRRSTNPKDSSDVVTETYDLLAALGVQEHIWPPLRHVLREHAVILMEEAGSQGLFDAENIEVTLMRLANGGYNDIRSRILSACVDSYRRRHTSVVYSSRGLEKDEPEVVFHRLIKEARALNRRMEQRSVKRHMRSLGC